MQILTSDHPSYPQKLLAVLGSKAPTLYCEGDISLLNTPCLAVVGTREPTEVGALKALEWAGFFAKEGITIVSGLALGCDTCAHLAARFTTKKTIAVLGTTLDDIYPKENKDLAQRIANDGGLLLTEYTESKYAPWRFKERDYLQAALSNAVLPIQGWKGSGTRHACRAIKQFGRDLYTLEIDIEDKKNYPEKYELIELLLQQGQVTAILTEENKYEIAKRIRGELK